MLTLHNSTERRCINAGSEIGVGERMNSTKTMGTLARNLPLANQGSEPEEKVSSLQARCAKKTSNQIVHVVPPWLPPPLPTSPIYAPSLHTPTPRTPIHAPTLHTSTLHSSPLHISTQARCARRPPNPIVQVPPL
jgi:hypothetical protein